ncbi:MAG: hypothetical protein OQK07_01835 [Rhodospirillales bacterium]|nr:hypothetical protein [Rhodospirillales bacterium]
MSRLSSTLRALQPLPGVVLAVGAAMVAWAVRYGFIEPERFGAACEGAGPWWCAPRTGFIIFTQWNGFGWVALLLAGFAVVWFVRGADALRLSLMVMAIGGAGLILYNAGSSAVAVVVAVLLLSQHREDPRGFGDDVRAQGIGKD